MRPAALLDRPIERRDVRRPALPLAMALAAVGLATAAPARADNLDAALLKHAPEVLAYLRDHHVRNVGVLKFRVHKAGHPSSFKTGPINDNLAGRLENALIAANSPSAPIGVVRNASHVAAARGLPRYDSPAGQLALFAQKYPLAWGNEQVTPDLMLTGVVNVRADLKSATVQIEGFGPTSPKQDKVIAISVATDRSLLADLNESFQVKEVESRGLGKRKTRSIELDEEAVADAASYEAQPPVAIGGGGPPAVMPPTPPPNSLDYMLNVVIRYDGRPQPVTSDPDSPGELRVAEPREGQIVTFIVKSQAIERIGLVLMINGKNTLYEEEGDPAHCKAWVLDPGREYGIDGFQVDNATRKPFRVLSDEESAAASYGANTGLIQFHIVKQGPGGGGGLPEGGGKLGDPADPMNISLRGLKQAKSRSLSFVDLQKTIKAQAHMPARRKTRGLIAGDGAAVGGAIENDEVKDQVLVKSIAVRYYKPKGQ